MPLQAMALDLNGVLVDDEWAHYEIIRDLVSSWGIALQREDYNATVLGLSDQDAFTVLIHDLVNEQDLPKVIKQLCRKKKLRYLRDYLPWLEPCPGALVFVQEAFTRYPLALVTGASRGECVRVLQKMGLWGSFKVVITARKGLRGKPAPDPYLVALRHLRTYRPGLQAYECVAIEDSLEGISAARAAGFYTLAVPYTLTSDYLTNAHHVLEQGLLKFPWTDVEYWVEQNLKNDHYE